MVDDRVWTVRFRQATADWLREHASQDGLTVQQVIVKAVESLIGESESIEGTAEPQSRGRTTDQDVYQYSDDRKT